jgi:hypothetical protein
MHLNIIYIPNKITFPKRDFVDFFQHGRSDMVIENTPYLLNGGEFLHSLKSVLFGKNQGNFFNS